MSPSQLLYNLLKTKKMLLFVGLFSILLSVANYYLAPLYYYFVEMFSLSLSQSSLSITLFFVAIFSLFLVYLQSGGKEPLEEVYSSYLASSLEDLESKIQLTNEQVIDLTKKIESFNSNAGLSKEEKKLIISGAVEKTSEEAIKTIFKNETHNLREIIESNLSLKRLTDLSEGITRRLRREITDLRLRSNVNLLIGMVITGGGLYLLWTTVSIIDSSELLKQLASEGDDSNYKFIKNIVLPIIPRVLLVVFIEVFAYFFLKLYKNGLSEIKYFQNELTNIESKLAAVEFSHMTKNQDALKISIESLSKTERNFILDKGQTTVELERAKSESELTRNIIKTIPGLFKRAGK
ncbi:hypothetical protein ACR9H8_11595 [Kosakonia cowanii]